MILCRSPLRVSFFGGGTDFEDFIKENKYGQVLSCSINQYVYLLIKKNSNKNYKIHYSKTENVKEIKKIKHKYFRKILKKYNINNGIEISTHADIKAGKGLSSSSSLGSNLILAFEHFKNNKIIKDKNLWVKTYKFEKNSVKNFCGLQDQFIICNGGFRLTKFYKNFKYKTKNINLDKKIINFFKKNLILIDTKIQRNYLAIMNDQKKRVKKNSKNLILMRNLTNDGYECIKNYNFKKFGLLLNQTWRLKKSLSKHVSNHKKLAKIEKNLMEYKPWGMKILGAGGGGMILVCAEQKKIKKIVNSKKFKTYSFLPTNEGTKIVYTE